MSRIRFVTYQTPLAMPEYVSLLRSAARYGFLDHLVTLTVDVGGQWPDHRRNKPRSVERYLAQSDLRDDDIICFMDAMDTLFVRPDVPALLDAFRRENCLILFGAETNCYQLYFRKFYRQRDDALPARFAYLNAGLYMGYVRDVKNLTHAANAILRDAAAFRRYFQVDVDEVRRVQSKEGWSREKEEYFTHHLGATGPSDQAAFHELFLKGFPDENGETYAPIRLDRGCRVFQNINNPDAACFEFVDGRWRNRFTGSQPFLVHAPGNTGHLRPIAKPLGIAFNLYHHKDIFHCDDWPPEYYVPSDHVASVDDTLNAVVWNFHHGERCNRESYQIHSSAGEILPRVAKC